MTAAAFPPDPQGHLRWVAANHRIVFGPTIRLDQAIAFVAGFDAATGYALLRGFQEWLVVQLGTGFEIHWFGLARCLAQGVPPPVANASHLSEDEDMVAALRFLESVIEFLDAVDDRDGRRVLYRDFDRLRGQE